MDRHHPPAFGFAAATDGRRPCGSVAVPPARSASSEEAAFSVHRRGHRGHRARVRVRAGSGASGAAGRRTGRGGARPVRLAENSLKAEQERIKGLMDQLKGYNPGTPEYRKFEGEVAKAQGDFSVNAQLQKKDFMDREAKVYLQVYNEIERAVSQFARDHGIAVVHRFDGDPVDASDRNRILGSITKPIVYYDPQIDITPDVLKMLNGATVAAQPQPGQPRR
jgi:hypothetical protein